MVPKLILLASALAFWWLIKRDIGRREGISLAIWIPTLWVGILASRPLSTWLGFGGEDTLEGSPMDRLFFFGMIAAALTVLVRREIVWSSVIRNGWPVLIFYGFLLISVAWANSPVSSFKRWFKESGNILILLVILTETNPQQALRAVFVRCAYVLIPLSEVFIRYFPDLGRRYNIHSGEMEAIGVTFQKNSLGAMVLVCTLVLIWDWLQLRENRGSLTKSAKRLDDAIYLAVMLTGFYLLYLCDSKTSIVVLAMGGCLIVGARLAVFRGQLKLLGSAVVAAGVGLYVLDQMFGIKEAVISGLGRDMTFTGRTDVWRELLNVNTDPIFGTGYMSFWDDKGYRSKLPEWVAFSAHNGYLEVYLAGGILGIFALVVMLLATGLKLHSALSWGADYAVLCFGIYLITLIVNFSESNFACMTPVGFLFLLAAIGEVKTAQGIETSAEPLAESQELALSDAETNETEDSAPILNGT